MVKSASSLESGPTIANTSISLKKYVSEIHGDHVKNACNIGIMYFSDISLQEFLEISPKMIVSGAAFTSLIKAGYDANSIKGFGNLVALKIISIIS